MIYIESKRRKRENIEKQYPNAIIWDITSTSENEEARKLSPFYPHGGVHIPSFSGMTATCVEAVWQGLKVFENSDIDVETFKNDTMKGLKRTVRRFGPIRGHRKGEKLLNYIEARKQIYIPTYEWVLKNVPAVKDFVSQIAKKAKEKDVVLLDYSTNTDINNTKSPVSHAGIVKEYIEKRYPEVKKDFTKPALKKPKSKKSSSKKGKKGKRTSEPIQTEIPW